jgi:S-adenosylmethionine:tRNA ribosyltransferase-isomerase
MNVEEFDYRLPPELIAQEPSPRREEARLMLLDRAHPEIRESRFASIGDHLRAGDLLVVNDTRVVPARLEARKPTGGRVELLLVRRDPDDPRGATWSCLATGHRGIHLGTTLEITDDFQAEVLEKGAEGRLRVRMQSRGVGVDEAIRLHGVPPVPPYIRREPGDPRREMDRQRYQTVYARTDGAIAAPTAGLHFTRGLLRSLEWRGVTLASITLHVGPGTFQPVRTRDVDGHVVEAEWCHLPSETAAAIAACRARGNRVVSVGTTVARALEWRGDDAGGTTPGEGMCDLTIRPGHRFVVVDALLTNFHLPRSSLLILVAAFAGRERILEAYGEAVARRFRFYSYGDAMLIQ